MVLLGDLVKMMRVQAHPTPYSTDLNDAEWDQMKSLVTISKSGKGKRGRVVELERRGVLNAIFMWCDRVGPNRLLPHDFGPWQAVYAY